MAGSRRWLWLAAVAVLGCAAPEPAGPTGGGADTVAPDTVVPDTVVPDTVVPDTVVPDTVVPDTVASDTSADAAADATAPMVTTVVVHHPAAHTLGLRGDKAPLSWAQTTLPTTPSPPVAPGATQVAFTLPLTAGALRVKAVRTAGGKLQWSIGANHVIQPGQTRHLYPYFEPKHGQGRREDFAFVGPAGKARTVRVFLPPGYDENTLASYPLLVLFDGQNIFDAKTATFGVAWQVQDAVRASLTAGALTEVVVAAVDHGGAARVYEYTPWADPTFTPTGGGGAQTLDWLSDKVLPELHKRYRLHATRPVIGGSSLGGLMSLFAALDRPKVWRGAMAMSGSWWWKNKATQPWAVQQLPAAVATGKSVDAQQSPALPPGAAFIGGPTRVWLDAGTVNDGLANTQALHGALQATGLLTAPNLGLYVHQGASHTELAWQQRVHLPLRFFFDPGDREPAF